MSYCWHSNNRCVHIQLLDIPFTMKTFKKLRPLFVVFVTLCSCTNNVSNNQSETTMTLSDSQTELINEGWYIPKTKPEGELPKEYGIENKYGQQDNYFEIKNGNGCDVAIKIMDDATDKCIRYVFVSENSSANIQMIPQGKYYLKLAYGKDWMEYDNGDGTLSARFTSNVTYDRSTDVFDFGKKNSSSVVNHLLQINVVDSKLQNSFCTVEISESEFIK